MGGRDTQITVYVTDERKAELNSAPMKKTPLCLGSSTT